MLPPFSWVRPIRSCITGLALTAASCGPEAPGLDATGSIAPDRDFGAALRAAVAAQSSLDPWLARPGVVGTGVTLDPRGEPVLVVLLEKAGAVDVPKWAGSVPVQAEPLGGIDAYALTDRHRPVPIGVSAGNANECLPGTIGAILERGGERFLLSANHVFARQNQAALGEIIVQPSLPDADPACGPAPPSLAVGRLADFEPVVYDGRTPNRMDAAIARVTTDESTCSTLPDFYGLLSSQVADPAAGLGVLKVGRTTGLTRGAIKAIHVKVKVRFPAGTALFVDQILTSKAFGAFGDSGALLVTDDGTARPVGMIIGGSPNGAAIASPIGPILERFGATVCGGDAFPALAASRP